VAAEVADTGSIVLEAGRYVGRPVDEVVDALTRLGLDVRPRSEVRDDVAPDEVTGVDHDGEPLSPGDTVVVTYATPGPGSDGPRNRPVATGAADGGGAQIPVVEEQPVTVDPGAQTSPAPATTAPATPTTSVTSETATTSRTSRSPAAETSDSETSPATSTSTSTATSSSSTPTTTTAATGG
jgi:serine/threonine-protein kinase